MSRRRVVDELRYVDTETATQRAYLHLARAYEAAAEDHARRAMVLEQRGDLEGAEHERRRCRVKHRLARAAVDGRHEG
jgi:hypothetical protein